jgi:hypothetical protein
MTRDEWYDKLESCRRRERDVHEAMLEAPVEEAPIYFEAMYRIRAEWREVYSQMPR